MKYEEKPLPSVLYRIMFALFSALSAIALFFATALGSNADTMYVANEFDQTISVIDSSKNVVVATVPVNDSMHSMAMAKDASKLYVSTTSGSNVRIFNTTTNSFTGAIPLPDGPAALAVSPDGASLYASSESGNVYIISTASGTITQTIASAFARATQYSAAFSSDGSLLFVATGVSKNVIVQYLNIATQLAGLVPIVGPSGCIAVVANPTSPRVYAGCTNYTVYAVDSNNQFVATPLPVGSQASGGAMTPDGGTLYFATESSGILAIDPTTLAIRQAIPDAGFPWGVAMTADGKHAYVTNILTSTVSVIDTSTNAIVSTIPVGISPDIIVSGLLNIAFAKYTPELLVAPKLSAYSVAASFTLGTSAPALTPTTQNLTLTIGNFSVMVPAGSVKQPNPKIGIYTFNGVLNGAEFGFVLTGNGSGPWGIVAVGSHAFGTLSASTPVTLSIGQDSGTATVKPLVVTKVQSLH